MKVPLRWLRDYVDVTLPVEQLAVRHQAVFDVDLHAIVAVDRPARAGRVGHIHGEIVDPRQRAGDLFAGCQGDRNFAGCAAAAAAAGPEESVLELIGRHAGGDLREIAGWRVARGATARAGTCRGASSQPAR